MTALAGAWRSDAGDPGRTVTTILRAQQIYGQSSRQLASGAVALGRRLFDLVPEDVHDDGPIIGGDGALLLVADVRLDNRDELRDWLGIPGGAMREMSDAGLLMRALEAWGRRAVDRLHGDFAF